MRVLLADHEVIPREWAEILQDSQATDTADVDAQDDLSEGEHGGEVSPDTHTPAGEPLPTPAQQARKRRQREELLSRPEIRRAAETFPTDPLVEYHWPTNRETVLWHSGADLLQRRTWPAVARAGKVYYRGPDIVIDQDLVDAAIDDAYSKDLRDALRS
jgi:hypothetical protein